MAPARDDPSPAPGLPDPPFYRVVAGLGNPGREYEQTRHNVGFLVLDRLAERLGAGPFAYAHAWETLWTRAGDGRLCLKPTTYMNLSGRAVAAVARFYKVPAAGVLVVYDDVALPLGRLRLRPGGSAGGHNGVRSLVEQFGTTDLARVRVGIGAARGGGDGLLNHVLGRFRADEAPLVQEAVERAVEAIEVACRRGFAAAMNQFNGAAEGGGGGGGGGSPGPGPRRAPRPDRPASAGPAGGPALAPSDRPPPAAGDPPAG